MIAPKVVSHYVGETKILIIHALKIFYMSHRAYSTVRQFVFDEGIIALEGKAPVIFYIPQNKITTSSVSV